MATSKADRAARLIVLAERVLADGTSGSVMDDPRFLQMAFSGLTARVDSQIRKRSPASGPWGQLPVEQVREIAEGHPGLIVLLAAHPNGFVRAEAVALACDVLHQPGPARMVALRTVDSVPAIRTAAIGAVTKLLSSALLSSAAEHGDVLPTNVAAAARQVISTARCLDTCPGVVDLALDLVPPTYSNGFPSQSDREVHRRQQTLTSLREKDPSGDPAEESARHRLIEWYEGSLEAVLLVEDALPEDAELPEG